MTVLAPPTTTADPELDALITKFGARWEITRRTDYGGTPGAFHAVRHDPRPSLQGLRSATAEGLRSAIECAEAMPR
ncbi:hypothetical protein GCM10007147_21710 [Nocardiopsis kunsanensis]|uniref:Uncharacterized protein n=1 Tax=Nocardiopsis kunsanensis TaxID=141693 RepID=A0A919CHI6_9ACTN|nr:hypothetical protein [Nocardiopsis kunsanensis]GHD24961.1 hypothetical protein GCM10007147_21710 [Nocardiopsis kunsanensis]